MPTSTRLLPGCARCRPRSKGRHNRPSKASVLRLYSRVESRLFPMQRFSFLLASALAGAVFVVSVLAALPASAQQRQVPTSAAQLQLSFAPVVQRVAPAV